MSYTFKRTSRQGRIQYPSYSHLYEIIESSKIPLSLILMYLTSTSVFRRVLLYWVPQKLPQIFTVIAFICIGKVEWFAIYCGNTWNAYSTRHFIYYRKSVLHLRRHMFHMFAFKADVHMFAFKADVVQICGNIRSTLQVGNSKIGAHLRSNVCYLTC